MNMRLILIVFGLSLLLVPRVFGGGMQFRDTPTEVAATYSFNGTQVSARSLSIQSDSDTLSNSYAVGFSDGQSGDPENRTLVAADGSTLPYRIVDSAAAGNDLTTRDENPTSDEVLLGSLSPGDTANETFDVILPGGELPVPGSYSDNIVLQLDRYSTVLGRWLNEDQAFFDVVVFVPVFVDFALVPVGGTFDPGANSYVLDLGILEDGTVGRLDMLVRANVGYDISISSANEGNMAHTDPSDASLVPYNLRVDAGSVDLSGGPVTVATGTGPTAGAGERYDLELQIGDPGAASAGAYEDMLQVTVTAR